MKQFLVCFYILAVIVGAVSSQDGPIEIECTDPNEHFKTCSLSRAMCEPSCADREPYPCRKGCKKGCDCNSGYLRSENGTCVLPSEC